MPYRFKLANIFYYSGLAILIASLPLSKFTMSLSQMMLGFSWLLMGDFRHRLGQFFQHKIALALASIFLLHIIGLIYTTNFEYALKDLRIKIPLLILPFMFATFPKPTPDIFKKLILLFALSVTFATFISFYWFLNDSVTDYRDLSPFISHIRFSLLVCLAAFLMFYEAWMTRNPWHRVGYITMALWLVLMLFILQSATSLIIFFATAFVVILYLGLVRVSRMLRIVLLLAIGLPVAWGIWYSVGIFRSFDKVAPYDYAKLEKFTPSGNRYLHDTTTYWIENGRHAGLYQCTKELRKEWNKRSQIAFEGTDHTGQLIQYTLIRYLTSLDKRKDSAGVASLSKEDIANIENGVANHDYLTDSRFKTMINKITLGYYQYKWQRGARGSSMMQRIELWETSLQMIAQRPWFGVGTGDLPDEFEKQLTINNSSLAGTRLRSHNQFLSIATALGLTGLFFFVAALAFIILYRKMWLDYQALVSFCIVVFSMLNEDTIETQAGVTFFTFFLSFFFILKPGDAHEGNQKKKQPVERT